MVGNTGTGPQSATAAPGTLEVPTNPNPNLGDLNAGALEQLRRRFLAAIAGGEARLAMRFLTVRLCAINRWTVGRASEQLGIPEGAVAHYLNAYVAHGLDGLGVSPPGGEGFYG
jgi:hypothetical protein